jgi:hypothetical protein
MRSAEVSMHGVPSGILEEIEPEKKYRFTYFEKYTGPSIALTMPVGGKAFPGWTDLIQKCFLSDPMKTQYIDLLNERLNKLDLA